MTSVHSRPPVSYVGLLLKPMKLNLQSEKNVQDIEKKQKQEETSINVACI